MVSQAGQTPPRQRFAAALRGQGRGARYPPGPNFDPVWYRQIHGLAVGELPLAHFLARRSTERLAPCPALWSVANAPRDPAAPAGDDPFLPYLAADGDSAAAAAADVAVLTPSGLVDANHYLVANSDVTEAQADPVLHFCLYGWQEGRNPNAYFNTRWYTATNPEVTRLGVNPLVHYLLVGEAKRPPAGGVFPARLVPRDVWPAGRRVAAGAFPGQPSPSARVAELAVRPGMVHRARRAPRAAPAGSVRVLPVRRDLGGSAALGGVRCDRLAPAPPWPAVAALHRVCCIPTATTRCWITCCPPIASRNGTS